MRKTDKRIEVTRNKLKAALLELKKDKKVQNISISLICETAHVNRNTFYSHYDSVKQLEDELNTQFLDFFVREVESAMKKPMVNSLYDFFMCLLTSIQKQLEMCQTILGEDRHILQDLITRIFPMANELWANMYNIDIHLSAMVYKFIVGGAIAILEDWIKDGCKDDPKEVARVLNKLIVNGQSAFMPC